MRCLFALLGLLTPRVIIVLLAIFTTYMSSAYQTVHWPVLGFLFMPLTTLAYALAINAAGSVTDIYFLIVLLAVVVDVGSIILGLLRRRARKRRMEKMVRSAVQEEEKRSRKRERKRRKGRKRKRDEG